MHIGRDSLDMSNMSLFVAAQWCCCCLFCIGAVYRVAGQQELGGASVYLVVSNFLQDPPPAPDFSSSSKSFLPNLSRLKSHPVLIETQDSTFRAHIEEERSI